MSLLDTPRPAVQPRPDTNPNTGRTGAIVVPPLPRAVAIIDNLTHRITGACTGCYVVVEPDQVGTSGEVRRLDLAWCRTCWPGKRCGCKAPSGLVHNECSACLTTSIVADKQIERGLS